MERVLDKILFRGVRLVIILLACQNAAGFDSDPLSPLVSHHERLSYPTTEVKEAHTRHKRATGEDEGAKINFRALGRRFSLSLVQDHSMFHPGYEVTGPLGNHLHNLDHTHYEGWVEGEPDSQVFGSLRDGVFDGTIVTQDDGTFYVERAGRYRNLSSNSRRNTTSSTQHHSVIYHDHH